MRKKYTLLAIICIMFLSCIFLTGCQETGIYYDEELERAAAKNDVNALE